MVLPTNRGGGVRGEKSVWMSVVLVLVMLMVPEVVVVVVC